MFFQKIVPLRWRILHSRHSNDTSESPLRIWSSARRHCRYSRGICLQPRPQSKVVIPSFPIREFASDRTIRLVILMGMTIQSSTPLPMIGNPIPVEKSENQFQQQNQLQQSNAQLVQSNQNSNPPPQLQQQQQFQQIPQRTQFGATAQSPQPPFQNQRTAPAQNPSYGGSWASSAQSNPQFPGQQPNSVFPNTSNQPKASGFIGQQNQQQNPFPSLNGPNAAPVAANARSAFISLHLSFIAHLISSDFLCPDCLFL